MYLLKDEVPPWKWRELAIAAVLIAAILGGALFYQSMTRERVITIRLDTVRMALR